MYNRLGGYQDVRDRIRFFDSSDSYGMSEWKNVFTFAMLKKRCIKCISSVFSAVISLPKFCWPAKRRSVGCADASHFWVGWLHFLSWVVCRVSVALAWVRIQCWRAWDIQQQHQLRNANYENLHTHLSSAKWIVYWKFIALKVRYFDYYSPTEVSVLMEY